MSNAKMNQLLGLILAATLLTIVAGCSKQSPRESDNATKNTSAMGDSKNIYQEGVEAYQAGKFSDAADKFRQLAEQGDAIAQFNLGSMYRQGQGVQQDDKQAVAWWTKAAEQGHTDAQDNLGLRYAKGEGVEQDWVQAYKWFSIAGMNKNESAAVNAKVAAGKMAPEKIEQAQNLAKEWLVQHKK